MYIDYISETTADYNKMLDEADTLEKLVKGVTDFKLIANDALKKVSTMDQAAFEDFRGGLAMERKRKFAGEEWNDKYGEIIIPSVIMAVAVVAHQFMVPWGCAYIRMRDAGKLVEKDGVAIVSADMFV